MTSGHKWFAVLWPIVIGVLGFAVSQARSAGVTETRLNDLEGFRTEVRQELRLIRDSQVRLQAEQRVLHGLAATDDPLEVTHARKWK